MVMFLVLALAVLAANAEQSPLAGATNYVFTNPQYPGFIVGRIMGPNTNNYDILRGEDQIYLFEAYSELYQVARAKPGSTFYRDSGIDRLYPWASYSRVGAVYNRLFEMFDLGTNGNRVIVAHNQEINFPSNYWPISSVNNLNGSDIAHQAVFDSRAFVTNYPDSYALSRSGFSCVLSRSCVASLYMSLKDCHGIANDFTANNSTNRHSYTTTRRDDYYSYDPQTEEIIYDTLESHPQYQYVGGGYYEYGNCSVQRYDVYGELTNPLYLRDGGYYETDDQITVPMFPTNFARAYQLGNIKSAVVVSVAYNNTKTTSGTAVINISTNYAAVIISTPTFTEIGGVTTALITPDYGPAIDQFYRETGLTFPDIENNEPDTPTSAGVGNSWNINVTMLPRRAALVFSVDWHTGFQHLGQ